MADLWAKAPASLIRDRELTATDLRVYLWIDFKAGRRGWWWGAQRAIAEALAVSPRGVGTAVAKLRERGYLSTRRTANRDGKITYTVHARTGSTLPILEPADQQSSADRIGTTVPIRGGRTSSGSQIPTTDPMRGSSSSPQRGRFEHVIRREFPPAEEGSA